MPILDHWERSRSRLPPGVPGRHLGAARGRPPDRGRRPTVEDAMSDRRRPGRRPRPVDVPLSERRAASCSPTAPRGRTGAGEAPVQRARMSNLVIHCQTAERGRRGRAADPRDRRRSTRRGSSCWSPTSHRARPRSAPRSSSARPATRPQLCSEQVTLRGGPHAAEHLPFAVRGLLIGDLPTNVWWANPTPAAAGRPAPRRPGRARPAGHLRQPRLARPAPGGRRDVAPGWSSSSATRAPAAGAWRPT